MKAAAKAITYGLKTNRLGRATFLPLSIIKENKFQIQFWTKQKSRPIYWYRKWTLFQQIKNMSSINKIYFEQLS